MYNYHALFAVFPRAKKSLIDAFAKRVICSYLLILSVIFFSKWIQVHFHKKLYYKYDYAFRKNFDDADKIYSNFILTVIPIRYVKIDKKIH